MALITPFWYCCRGREAESGATSPIYAPLPPPHSLPYLTCSSFILMVTVMGPWVAKCLAMPGGGRCHLALLPLHPLLSAHGHLYLSLPLSHPLAPAPRDPSVSVYSPVCPCPSPPCARLCPHPARTLLAGLQHYEILDPGHLLVLLSQAPVGFAPPNEWIVLLTGQAA